VATTLVAAVLGLLAAACIGDKPSASTSGPDGGAGAADYAIRCGSEQCKGTDVCCVVTAANRDFVSASCTAAAACMSTYLECDSVHECDRGLVCCANTNGGSFVWAASSCKTGCAGADRKLCDTAAECDGGCEPNVPAIKPPNLRACAL
jgi:hypothetical protein